MEPSEALHKQPNAKHQSPATDPSKTLSAIITSRSGGRRVNRNNYISHNQYLLIIIKYIHHVLMFDLYDTEKVNVTINMLSSIVDYKYTTMYSTSSLLINSEPIMINQLNNLSFQILHSTDNLIFRVGFCTKYEYYKLHEENRLEISKSAATYNLFTITNKNNVEFHCINKKVKKYGYCYQKKKRVKYKTNDTLKIALSNDGDFIYFYINNKLVDGGI